MESLLLHCPQEWGSVLTGQEAEICLISSERLCTKDPKALKTEQGLWLAVKENNENPNAEMVLMYQLSFYPVTQGQPCFTSLCMAPSVTPEVASPQYYFF